MHYARIPYTMRDGNIRLRMLLFTDIPFLSYALMEKGICTFRNRLCQKILSSWLSLWWWIKTTFSVIYCIEFSSQRVGFIGLYNLELRKSSEMTLVIFKKENRRRGYGSKAFALLAQYLKDHDIINKIIVRTETDNVTSLTFWRKLGFREVNISNDITTMHIDLDNYSVDSIDRPGQ